MIEIGNTVVCGQPRENVKEMPSQPMSWAWDSVPVVPTIQEIVSRRITV
jgi:hypothetical protein